MYLALVRRLSPGALAQALEPRLSPGQRGLPSTPSMRRLVVVKGGLGSRFRCWDVRPGFHPHSFDVALDAVLYEVRSHDAALSVSASPGRAWTRSRRELGRSLRCCDFLNPPPLDSTFLLRAAFLNPPSAQRFYFRSPTSLLLESLLSKRSFQNVHSRALSLNTLFPETLLLETLLLKTLFSKLIAPILDGRLRVGLVNSSGKRDRRPRPAATAGASARLVCAPPPRSLCASRSGRRAPPSANPSAVSPSLRRDIPECIANIAPTVAAIIGHRSW